MIIYFFTHQLQVLNSKKNYYRKIKYQKNIEFINSLDKLDLLDTQNMSKGLLKLLFLGY